MSNLRKLAYKRQGELYSGKYGVTPREFEIIKIQSQYQSIPHGFELQVAKTPNNIAIIDRKESISYDELNKTANRLGRVLQQECPNGKQAIGLLFEHGAASISAVLAVLKSGNIYVPLDSIFPMERLASHLSESSAKVLVTNTKNIRLGKRIAGKGANILNIDEIDIRAPDGNLDVEMSWETPAAIYFTSGSTGKPKGILKYHGNFLSRPTDLIPGDCQTHLFSFSFGVSSSNILLTLINGVTLCCFDARKRGITQLIDWLVEEGITIMHPPTSLLRQLLNSLDEDDFFPRLRRVNLGGQATYKKDVEEIQRHCSPDCLVRVSYASSEAGLVTQFFIDSNTVMEDRVLPAGYAVPNKEILILDDEGKPLGVNEVGEIAVRSRYLLRGYLGSPELMGGRFQAGLERRDEQIFLTGDLGVLRPDGLLVHRGRKDYQVKIRGYRVEVAEIETTLESFKEIDQAAVVAHEYKHSEEKYLAAYLAPSNHQKPSVQFLRAMLAKTLPDYMIPARIIIMDKLPQTPNGKVDRNALPEPDMARSGMENAYLAPEDKLEKQLAGIWEDVLEIDLVGIDDDFFDLGGSSLQAMQLFVEIEKMGGQKLPLSILLAVSTVRQQAEILKKKGFDPNWSPVVPVQLGGSKPPLFCLAGKGGNPLRFRQLAKRLGEERPIYFLQSRGLSGFEKPNENVVEIAADFLTEIQKIQPSGPYFMCGSSFGGLVAFEIAQQLLSQEEEVGLVALLDTYAPAYLNKKANNTGIMGMISRVVTYMQKQVENLITSDKESKRANFQYYLKMLSKGYKAYKQELRMILGDLRFRSITPEIKKVESANIRASRQYLPQSYPGKVVLLRATRLPIGAPPDPLLGWGDVDIGELVAHDVDSYHGNILFEPAVKWVSEILRGYLEK